MPETSIVGSINIYPSLNQKLHDLSILWMKANVDAGKLTPEEYYAQYKTAYDRMAEADKLAQKRPSILPYN